MGLRLALDLLRRAVALDPSFAIAHASMGWVLEKRIALELASARPEDVAEAVRCAHRALATGADDPRVMVIAGFVLVRFGDAEAGLAAARRARSLNPNDLRVLNSAGYSEQLAGDVAESRALFSRAVALAPDAPDSYLNITGIAFAEYYSHNYEAALAWARRSLQTFNDWAVTYWVLVAAAGQLGRTDDAAAYLQRLLELAPSTTLARFEGEWLSTLPHFRLFIDGLRKAGLR